MDPSHARKTATFIPGSSTTNVGRVAAHFVLHAGNRMIHEAQRPLVARLLRETISLHGICRAVELSIRWRTDCMVARFQALPDD